MTNGYDRLIDLRSAELRLVSGPSGTSRSRGAGRSRGPVRTAVGHGLMRLGERLAAPSGTPVHQ
jgi:hypothetical protein